jgi:cytochrome bd-type quinol oxidase subunit 2
MTSADRRAAAASRWMSIAVALLCLAIAALAFLKHAVPAVDEYADHLSLPLSAATLLLISGICACALLRSRAAQPQAGP